MFSDMSLNISSEIPSVPTSSIKFEDEFIDELKNYNKSSKMNILNKDDYRNRIGKLYNDIGGIKPIDNEINNVLYFDNYEEVGLVLNKKNISLKQVWTEYRLIYNEKQKEDDIVMENSFVLDNFDELFDKLAKKVDGVDNYIKELNSMKKEVDDSSLKLEYSRETLELEKIGFENYCREQSSKLEKKEKELNDKLAKVNELMKKLDEKMGFLLNDNEWED